MFVASDDWILFGEAKKMLAGDFLEGPTGTDLRALACLGASVHR
jgi:hypothetical protein